MTWKRLKKSISAAPGVAAALILMPYFALTYIGPGLIDVMRNERKTVGLFDRYFFGNGLFTVWLFAPINFLVDLFCYRNKRVYRPGDFSDDSRREIDEALAVFIARKDENIARIARELETERRGMFVYRGFGKQYNSEIEELNKPF